ncbi:MAG: type II secretion system F family protein [Acidimicrobiales bacterium]
MSRPAALLMLVVWFGATLVLAELRWFRRPRLVDRLARYTPGASASPRSVGVLSVTSFGDVVAPLAQTLGNRLSRVFGVSEELGVRLERVHSPMTVTAFRTRQLGISVAALALGAVPAVAVHPPPVLALLFLFGVPLLAFLVVEQQAVRASAEWQRRIFLELPIVSEQLGMLLGSGYSLGSALNRLARRGHGACATDLVRVCGRVRQGLSDVDALREWAALADVDALSRLVTILAMNREGGDLAQLISEEARTIRQDAQRELVETIERRGQQVWIPVTVATLVPGVLFMVVPFIEAMRLFTTG